MNVDAMSGALPAWPCFGVFTLPHHTAKASGPMQNEPFIGGSGGHKVRPPRSLEVRQVQQHCRGALPAATNTVYMLCQTEALFEHFAGALHKLFVTVRTTAAFCNHINNAVSDR